MGFALSPVHVRKWLRPWKREQPTAYVACAKALNWMALATVFRRSWLPASGLDKASIGLEHLFLIEIGLGTTAIG